MSIVLQAQAKCGRLGPAEQFIFLHSQVQFVRRQHFIRAVSVLQNDTLQQKLEDTRAAHLADLKAKKAEQNLVKQQMAELQQRIKQLHS